MFTPSKPNTRACPRMIISMANVLITALNDIRKCHLQVHDVHKCHLQVLISVESPSGIDGLVLGSYIVLYF